jgi:hypothetical protein
MAKKKVLSLDKKAQALIDDKKKADRLFFMAITRRKQAQAALDEYLKSRLPPAVQIQTNLFDPVPAKATTPPAALFPF